MTVKLITLNGETNTKAGWARKLGISCESITQRLNRGWSIADALTTPRHGRATKTKRRVLDRVISDNSKAVTATLMPSPFEEIQRRQLSIQRQFNSTLRQFNRELHALMTRSLDRGVVADLLENANDRSTPIA